MALQLVVAHAHAILLVTDPSFSFTDPPSEVKPQRTVRAGPRCYDARMRETRPSLLEGLFWLERSGSTDGVAIRDGAGAAVAGTLEGEVDRLLAGDGASGEVRLLTPDGRARTLVARSVPARPGLAVAVAAAELERRTAPVVETIANQVAHDVRNFAFTIGLQAELGERRTEGTPEVRNHFAAVLRQVDALKVYLEQLLLYGRPMAPRPIAADLASIARGEVQALQRAWKAGAPPPVVAVDVADDLGAVHWDPRLVGHALRALVDNAVRAADPQPEVAVRAAARGDRVVVEVADRGPGIAPETLAQLACPMRVRRHGGLGLGLAVARKVAAAHGGELELVTGAGGTTVRLDLPRVAAGD
jgi:signal transduction histidine kinase